MKTNNNSMNINDLSATPISSAYGGERVKGNRMCTSLNNSSMRKSSNMSSENKNILDELYEWIVFYVFFPY